MATGQRNTGRGPRKPREIVKTWAFDSLGDRKYAFQIQRAEDFPRLFETLDEVRSYMDEHGIKTPPGHKYVPGKKARRQ